MYLLLLYICYKAMLLSGSFSSDESLKERRKQKSLPFSSQCNERWRCSSLSLNGGGNYNQSFAWSYSARGTEEVVLYLLGKKSYQKCLENISSTERLKKFHFLSSLQLSLKVDQITQLCGNWLTINCSIIIKTWFTNIVTYLLVLSTCQRNMENAHEELACLTAAMGKL